MLQEHSPGRPRHLRIAAPTGEDRTGAAPMGLSVSVPVSASVSASAWSERRRAVIESAHAPFPLVAVLAAAATAEALIRSTVHLADGSGSPGMLASAVFLALGATVPLGFLSALGAATAASTAAVLALTITQSLTVAAAIAVVGGLYRLGWATSISATESLRLGRLSALPPIVLSIPYPIIALAGAGSSDSGALAVLLTALAPTAAFAGIAAQARTQARIHNAARESVARSLVEHTARGERARIARELHDVVAHHISMIAVQAETARLATPGMPVLGAERLLAIGDTARAGLTEMRRLLGVLKEDVGPPDQATERHPQPGLEQVLALVDDARRTSGSTTRLIVSGPPAALDPGVELAAYRIAQEALTNARRHAPGAPVDVELRFTPDALHLRILDSGPGPAAATAASSPTAGGSGNGDNHGRGHGLSGMHERAASVGGHLTTGPSPAGGFLVEAWLPADPVTAPAIAERGTS